MLLGKQEVLKRLNMVLKHNTNNKIRSKILQPLSANFSVLFAAI